MSEQKICLPEGIEVIDAPFGGFPLLLYLGNCETRGARS